LTTTAAPLQRAEGLELLGALSGAGYSDTPSLVRRPDGQTLQLTPLLYAVLEELDGRRGQQELADAVGSKLGRDLTAEDVSALVEKLQPLGVLHGSEPAEAATSNPLLALRWKVVASDTETTNRLTAPFAFLFSPFILWPVLAAFVGVCWFVLMEKGLASATHNAFSSPGLLLGVFLLGVLSAGFHELGHAAACRYGGATPGAMGAGIYLVWPAFYTNVDDSYRLDRRGRLRVDLGGLYFNALVAVVVTGLWLVTRQDALLLGVALQLLQMLRQLAPVIRADGYHILADWTGVPNLFAHLGPTLRGMLPWHWGEPSALTRKARLIVTAWVLVVVPVLLSMILTAVLVLPRLIASAWASGRVHGGRLMTAAEDADVLGVGANALKLIALALPVLGTLYLMTSIGRRVVRSVLSKTDGRPVLRGLATFVGLMLMAVLAWAWWPSGQYRPVSGNERGTIGSLISAELTTPLKPVASTTQIPALAMIPRGDAAADHPVLLMTQGSDGLRTMLTTADGGAATAFPFALPKAPGEGDNQALAVNDQDGSVVYDVAYALVTVKDGAAFTGTNSAYALASCTACTTVAVSFQVVLIVGQSDVIVPVNAAVAANGGCIRCVTTALAVQLVATLKEAPSEQVQAQLDAAMAKMGDLQGLDAASLYEQVSAVQDEVLGILEDNDLLVATPEATTASASASPSASTSADPSASPSASASASPSPQPTASASPSPTATATTTP
jgi:putative peptide zinc metalloprotease protein